MAKRRTDIPSDIAARVLFHHDRTCCVCRKRGKPVQIHHLDDDPSHHTPANLAVLCFDCHRDTQIRGGFDRKLDIEQIILYRDDWMLIVARQRAEEEALREQTLLSGASQVELATSLAEIYRDNRQYELLAIHYDVFGNRELRDKYIELALKQTPSDETISFLRGLQGRPNLIPQDVIDRKLGRHDADGDWEQKARFLLALDRHRDAAVAYIRGIQESLAEGNVFSAAYYLKELTEENVPERLFEIALREASEQGNIWLQIRALQELGWTTELRELLLSHSDEIERSADLLLQIELAKAQGNSGKVLELKKALARSEASTGSDLDEEVND